MLGPLAPYSEPHSYDLCEVHGQRLTVPRGWEVVRVDTPAPAVRSADDLEALADAVREAARPVGAPSDGGDTLGRRGHLRVLPTPG